VPFAKILANWPAERRSLLPAAQAARGELFRAITNPSTPPRGLLDAVDKYLSYTLAIEDLKLRSSTIQIDQTQRFHWTQSPILIAKYQDRFYDGAYVSVEVLHVLWLRATVILNLAPKLCQDGELENAAAACREAAGIFHFMATDRLRVLGAREVPIEFQPPVLNSLITLCLVQQYALTAAYGERKEAEANPGNVGKLCYQVSTAFSCALDAIRNAYPRGVIEPRYEAWLLGSKLYYFAAAAVGLARGFRAAGENGKAIGLLRLAMDKLGKIGGLHKDNQELRDAAAALDAKIRPAEAEYQRDNTLLGNQAVPNLTDADLIVASCTGMPPLQRPTPFVLPQPATL
jgi:hypothetical protein